MKKYQHERLDKIEKKLKPPDTREDVVIIVFFQPHDNAQDTLTRQKRFEESYGKTTLQHQFLEDFVFDTLQNDDKYRFIVLEFRVLDSPGTFRITKGRGPDQEKSALKLV